MLPYPVNEEEEKGLEEMHVLKNDYLSKNEGNVDERMMDFLRGIEEQWMLQFLRGRKCDSKYAWETLKNNTEVKFVKYPALFPTDIPEHLFAFEERPIISVLKARDAFGRRILLFSGMEWDADKISLQELTILTVRIVEKLLWDDDCINNGIMVIQNCIGLGFRHVKQYTWPLMWSQMEVFLHSYPVQFKEVIAVNVPYIFSFPLQLFRLLSPKKLRERTVISSVGRGFQDIYERLYPDVLPISFGGILKLQEAIDLEVSPF